MEADLARYYRADLRDRWRRGPDGRPLLTLRQLAVRVRHLPPDSATVTALNDGHEPWSLTHHLLADLIPALTGKDSPRAEAERKRHQTNRPADPERQRRLNRGRQRAAERRRRIEAGEIT